MSMDLRDDLFWGGGQVSTIGVLASTSKGLYGEELDFLGTVAKKFKFYPLS